MFRSMYLLLPHGVPLSCIICFTMGQEFTLVPEPVYQLTGSNHSIELIWNFEHDGIALSGTTWRNGDNILVMKQTGNQTPVVSNDFIDRVSHRTPFGLSIWNLTKEDEGEYTCRVVYIGGQKQSKVNVTLYDIDGGLSPKIELYGDGAGIEEETGVIVKSNLTAKYFVPIQNPVAITTTISTDFIGSVEIRETCNDYNGTYCEVTFTAPNKTGKLIISACNSHPALTDELCERLAVNIIDPYTSSVAPDDTSVSPYTTSSTEDPNTLISSLAPDDTSISSDSPPTTKDPSVTQPSSSPTVTTTSAPQSGWSHWYILLIALGCLVILVVIAVIIHRRTLRKDDDLDPVTELKPPSVHAAPAGHVRANTGGYRPSQHQQPRREDSTAYYVQGTSGARLWSRSDGRDLYMLTIKWNWES